MPTIAPVKITKVYDDIYHFETTVKRMLAIHVSYFIDAPTPVLIETGPATAGDAVLEGIRRVGRDPAKLKYIIPTHIHVDHAGGIGHLASTLPQATFVLHREGVRHMTEPERLIASTKQAFGDDFETDFGPIVPILKERVMVIEGGEKISLDKGRELQLLYTPGHAHHCISAFDTKSRGLFCGEALGVAQAGNTDVGPAAIPPSFDPEAVLETVAKVRALNPDLLFFSHGGPRTEVKSILDSLERNTKLYGEIILAGMKAGENPQQIGKRLAERQGARRGGASGEGGGGAVMAYMMYYRRKGIVPS